MAYATINDIFGRFPAIATNVGTGQYDVTSVQVSSVFIAQAEGVVNAYLRQRYIVPLDANSIDPLITRITADLAICDMLVDKLPKVPEFAAGRCEHAMDLLKMIQSGKLDLGGATDASTTGGDLEAWSTTQDYHPVFSPVIDPVDQRVDTDRIENDVSDRKGDGGFLGSRFIGNGY